MIDEDDPMPGPEDDDFYDLTIDVRLFVDAKRAAERRLAEDPNLTSEDRALIGEFLAAVDMNLSDLFDALEAGNA